MRSRRLARGRAHGGMEEVPLFDALHGRRYAQGISRLPLGESRCDFGHEMHYSEACRAAALPGGVIARRRAPMLRYGTKWMGTGYRRIAGGATTPARSRCPDAVKRTRIATSFGVNCGRANRPGPANEADHGGRARVYRATFSRREIGACLRGTPRLSR